jgi:hypothetical protein
LAGWDAYNKETIDLYTKMVFAILTTSTHVYGLGFRDFAIFTTSTHV